ncbi:hypothetical protein KR009_002607 [Drosophila setifemur]|nr:hypothetical protein KR009_002607 [Drosophila setifemur]
MSAIVRGNKASRLRAGQLPAKIVKPGVWASGPIQSGSFGPAQSNPNPAPPRSVSRLPVRIPGVRTSRNTSPNHSIGPIDRAISSCSLPQRLGLGSTVGDHKSNNATEEKEETKPVVPQPRTNTPAPQRGREKIGASNPKISNIQPPRSVSCQSAGAGENKSKLFTAQRSHHQVLELTRMRTIEAQHKKLEHMQSEFLDKLRTAGPLAKKLTGVYKFVTMVVNDECKVVMHEDDLLRLPKNLPTESVNDLKNRCRTVVELGLMAVYDFMPQIQLAKSDREARDKREELRCKLKALVNRRMVPIVEEIEQLCGPMGNRPEACNQSLYREIADIRTQKQHMETRYFDLKKELCDTVNQQRAEFEAKQTSELALRDHTINELKKALKRSEEMVQQQTVQLAEKSESLKTEDVTSEKLRSELDQLKSVNTRINLQLEEAIAGLERANCSVKKQEGKIIYLEGELKEAREFIVSLQKRPDTLDKGVVEKDLIIADLKLQLQNIEHSKNMLQKQVKTALKQHGEFEELDGKHQSALSQINDLKQMLKSSAGEKENQAKTEEKLRKELAKMREQIDQDQHMLTMRGDLINSLQETEKDTRTKLDKMYYQVSEKDTLINQVRWAGLDSPAYAYSISRSR